MKDNPNLITESGREHLSLADRAGLLNADLLWFQMNRPKYDRSDKSTDAPCHAAGALLGRIRACIKACTSKEVLNGVSWGTINLSKVECEVLAWRRGGYVEATRVHALAWRDYRTPIVQLVRLLKTIIPLAASAYVGRCYCGRAIPWERIGWANPTCYNHPGLEEDAYDVKRRGQLEAQVKGPR